MSNPGLQGVLEQFSQSLVRCQQLYRSSAEACLHVNPAAVGRPAGEFLELLHDLHKGVLIKVYVEVAQADARWSWEEKRLAECLFSHLWPGGPSGQLRETANHVFREAAGLRWASLLRPFRQYAVLQSRGVELAALIEHLADLVASVDGELTAAERQVISTIRQEVQEQLRPADELLGAGGAVSSSAGQTTSSRKHREARLPDTAVASAEPLLADPREAKPVARETDRLSAALTQLDALVGLRQVKEEVRTLTNFLKLQRQRAAAGLPQTRLSLHLVFAGNPGTGKTTVARIIGEIYGAMGILRRGHLVETDRSGLVAEYSGQTGPKTNQKIDEALDGVLFIDEAYSLIDESGEDPYGREAVQTLLKRMEDDRDRLVVILAGYSAEMDRLLRSNPGLLSRFSTRMTFVDYSPGELGHIFGRFCEQHHYVYSPETQLRTLLGLWWLYQHRDEHFGNARLVRNLFEMAIRQLANRVASVADVTAAVLTTIEPEDLLFPGIPAEWWQQARDERMRLRVPCPGCGDVTRTPPSFLGRKVRCLRCQQLFRVSWEEPEEATPPAGA